MTMSVLIHGIPTDALIDSGAARDFMSEKFASDWGLTLVKKKTPYLLATADGTLIAHNQGQVAHEVQVNMEALGQKETIKFDVTNTGNSSIILGLPWLQRNQPHIDWKNLIVTLPTNQCSVRAKGRLGVREIHSLQRTEPITVEVVSCYRLEKFLEDKPAFEIPSEYKEFSELFTEEAPEDALPPHQPWDHEIELKKGTQPKKFKIYPLRQDQLDTLREYVTEFRSKGFIRESKSPAGYPVFYVPKPDGGLRLCVDYRHLNEITVKNAYTLPLIQELRDRLQGAMWFTKFDIPAAFHRIRIKKGDEWKTAFRTHFGHYEYVVMPFGLTNAPATFQSYINNVLREYIDVFVCVYIDDILIYSRTIEEHVEHVRKVLHALKKYNLRLKPSKSEFHKQRVTFVGCVVTPDGLEVDPDKIAKVQEWPVPTSVKEVQSFHGFANYYRQFIRGFSKVAAPLTSLMSKSKEFIWTNEHQKAFDELKQLLMTTPVLALFDPDKPCTVETDASKYALGAVLSQPGKDGKLRPVAFHARKFIDAETRYPTGDQELLAIVDALKHWRYYLEGAKHPFTVFTDHANLRNFTTTKELNLRQLRWSDTLASFNFTVIHRSGKLNANADALSRRADFQDGETVKVQRALFKQEGDVLVHQVAVMEINTIEGLDEIKRAQNDACEDQMGSHHLCQELGLQYEDGVMHHEGLIWLPPELEKKWILKHHEPPLQGHARPEVVLERLRRNFWFLRMRQKVFAQIHKCDLCRRAKYERHKPHGLLQPNAPPEKPWQVVSMDFMGPLPKSVNEDGVAYENVMVVIDRLTKYAEFVPLPKKTSTPYLAKIFIKHIVTRYGIPERIISDRDRRFTSHFWEELCQALQITRAMSTAYHPVTDGQTERMNQTLEQYLRLYVDDEQSNWSTLLPQAAFAYNATKQDTIGMSPFFANYGREPRLTTDAEGYLPTEATAVAGDLQSLHQQLRSDIRFLNHRMAKTANKKRIEGPILKKGDKVYLWRRNIKTKRQSGKLDFLKLGPFKIKAIKGPVNYELELPQKMRIHPVFHVSLLEKADPETPINHAVELDPTTLEQLYEVEAVLDHAGSGRQRKYLVKWLGYPHEENTWEPTRNIQSFQDLIDQYHQDLLTRQRRAPKGNHAARS
jgi:transposase InsO family protein